MEPSFSCIGFSSSIAETSFNQLGSFIAQVGSFLLSAIAAALPPATQEAMFSQRFLLSSSSIESSPKISESARTTTRPLPYLAAAIIGASAGEAEALLVATT